MGYLQSQEKKQKTLEIAKKSHVYVVLPNNETQLSSYVMPAKLDITPQASANLGVFGPKESKNSPSHSLGKYILSKPTRSSAIHNEMALYNEPSGGD